jgi:hypothetical protein
MRPAGLPISILNPHPLDRTSEATLRELRIGSRRVTLGEPLSQTAEIAHPLINARTSCGHSSNQLGIGLSPGRSPSSRQMRPASLFGSKNPGRRTGPPGLLPDP